MAQTIRLLSTYQNYRPNDVISVDDATATALLAGGVGATTDLTGGTQRYIPPAPTVNEPSRAFSRGNRLVVFGDSLTAFGGSGANVPASYVNGMINVQKTNHGEVPGNSIVLHLAPTQAAYNGVYRVDTVIDANNFTVVPKAIPTAPETVEMLTMRSFSSKAWWATMNGLLGAPFDIVANAGIGGNTTPMMLGRLDTDVLTYSPDFCTLLGGVNDIRYASTSSGNPTIAAANTAAARDQAFQNIKAICRRLIGAGVTPILCTLLPVSSADAGFAISTPEILKYNDMLRAFALSNKSIILADIFGSLVDNTASDNRALTTGASPVLSDTVHVNAIGAFRVGRAAADAVRRYAPIAMPLISSNADTYTFSPMSANRQPNPLLVATAGGVGAGVTGQVATGLVASCTGGVTAAASVVARTFANDGDNYGFNQRLVATATATGVMTVRSAGVSIAFNPGDEALSDFVLKISSTSGVQYMNFDLTIGIGGVDYHAYLDTGSNNGFPNGEDHTKTIRIPKFKLPVGAVTAVTLYTNVAFNAAGGATIELGRLRTGPKVVAA